MILKELRQKNKISQNEIAKILGVDRSNYSRYESGAIEPNIQILQKRADYFNVSIDYLLGRDSQNTAILLNEQKEAFNYLRELKGPYLQMATGYLKKLAEDQSQISNLKYRG